jgi:hypothetical protein
MPGTKIGLPRPGRENIALFLLSMAVIAFELDVMRVFSVGNWSNFGEMVISIALLGMGLAGTLITFLQKRIREKSSLWLRATALSIAPVIAISYILAQQIPFNPVWLVSQKIQWLWIALFYAVYSLPFFCAALFFGVIFTVRTDNARSLYFWNMAGSGLGGVVLLGLMYLLPTRYLIIPVVLLAASGAVLLLAGGKKKPMLLVSGILLALVSAGSVWIGGRIRVSDFKGNVQAHMTFADLEQVHYGYSPLGEMEVFQSAQYHFAPGLSDNAVFYLEMPQKAFWALYINGDGPIGIMRELKDDEKRYIDFLPMTAPYTIKKDPKVMLVGLGGGFGAFTALHHNATEITVAERNSDLIHLMKNNPAVSEFNGHLLDNPKINLKTIEPRAYAVSREARKQYDVVEISLIDSVGLSNSVGNPVSENYTYTVDAIEDYWKALNDDGLLVITVWNNLDPPRNVPRLILTAVEALKRLKVADPGAHIYSFDLLYSTATIIIKKSPLTAAEVETLNDWCYRMSFEPLYYPGIPPRPEVDFNLMLDSFRLKYAIPASEMTPETEMSLYPRRPADFYYYVYQWALAGKGEELRKRYIFDISPSTDNRPFFTAFLNRNSLSVFLDELAAISEEWGYLLILGTLIQALFFGVLIILIPLIGGRKSRLGKQSGIPGIILYYSCLGVGYMLIEIFLIQKLVFFLADPVFSTSIVITSMLIISGLGSLFSGRFGNRTVFALKMAGGIVALVTLGYIFLLPGLLDLFLGWPLPVRMIIAVLTIAPAAFCMGMFFPSGLAALSRDKPELVPWAWGVNGALSVTGSLLPKMISIHWGFSTVLILAAVIYIGAGLLYPANLRKAGG